MKELLKTIRDNNILLEIVDGQLNVLSDEPEISPELLMAIRDRKTELLQFLSGNDQPLPGDSPKSEIPVAPVLLDYPLSSAQRRLWLLSHMPRGSLAYHITKAFFLEGDLNEEAFAYSFKELVARHEILRTLFRINEEGQIRQFVLSPGTSSFCLGHTDLRNEENQKAAIKNWVEQQWRQPFDLSAGPLIRASLAQLAENKWVFTCVLHHIISDGWSMGVMIDELFRSYNARSSKQEYPLTPLRIQYKDYAYWQHLALKEGSFRQQKEYWMRQLAGELPVLELPADKVRPPVKDYNGGIVRTTLDHKLTTDLKTLVKYDGCTLFMGLLSVTYALLYRYTGHEDIIIGSPIAGRDDVDLENQIGFYVNTLALRSRFKGTDNYKELLGIVRRTTLEAYENQGYPFDESITALDLQRDMSRNALFDVMVVLQNADNQEPDHDKNSLGINRYEEAEEITSKFDLSFIFTDAGKGLNLEIEYNSDIYNKDTVVRMLGHFQQLLEAIVRQPLTPIQQLDYISSGEKQQVLEIFNDTAADFFRDKTIVSLFEEQVDKKPDAIALVYGEANFTFREINELANQLGCYLRLNYHIMPDDLVGVQLERSEWMIISLLGVLKSGGAYVPIDPDYPRERIDYLISDSSCKIVIDEEELARFINSKPGYDTKNIASPNKPEDLAYVIYTSGSTGRPKGCMLEHRGVINRIQWMWEQFGFKGNDIILQKTNFTFDVSVWEIFMPLCWGAKMVICRKEDARSPGNILALIEKYGITCLHFVPGMLSAFVGSLFVNKDNCRSLKSLHCVITSGEELLPDTVREWYDKTDIPIHNLYGPTEASIDVTYFTTSPGNTKIPIGRPIWNTQIFITDHMAGPQPVLVAGEICIGGVGLARGYLNRPELTAEKFITSPLAGGDRIYKTGDLGRWLPDGNIEFIGRIDDQVKVRGYRVELGEITNALQTHPHIDAAVVIARHRSKGDKELVAYTVSREVLNTGDLRAYLAGILPAYMIPGHFVPIAALPLTFNGKIDRKKLPDPDGLTTGNGVEYIAPENELERKTIAIVEEVTGKKGIGMKDNFFALGGDSIKVISFVVAVRKQLGLDISVNKLYQARTLRDWAACLSVHDSDSDGIYRSLAIGLEEIEKIKTAIEEEDRSDKRLPDDYTDIYPIMQIEQGMIYSSLVNPAEPVYYDQYSFVVRIDDLDRFKEKLAGMVKRHPILRTIYYIKTFSQPVKVVMPEIALPLVFQDITQLSKEDKIEKINQCIEEDLNIRLTFDNELLWRINLFRLDGNEYCIIYSIHHSLLDGWSVSVFKTEISNPDGPDLPMLKHNYKDYCAISIGRRRSAGMDGFWKNLLKGYTRNKLPFNYKGLRINDTLGMRKVSKTIDSRLLDDISRMAGNHQLSLKAVCVAAHIYLLHIICAEQDITTGIVTHERPEIEDGDKILGCFLTTIPIRVELDKLTDILSLLQNVNDFIAGVKSYEVHLSEISKIIGDRTSFGNPIFDTLLNYTDFHTFEKIKDDTFINTLEAGTGTSDMEVSNEMTNTLFDVEVSKTLNRFSARIKYAPGYFNREDVQFALDLYIRILESFAKNVYAPLASLNLLTERELKEILIDFNATESSYAKEKTVQALFEEQVIRTPHAIALRQDGIDLSYGRLNERANRLAAHLIRLGISKGDNVGLLASRSFDMIVGMYGILKAGAAYVPIDPEYPLERQEYIIQNSGVKKLVADTALPSIGQMKEIEIITMREEELDGYGTDNPGLEVNSSSLAYTIYTSGSTGKPKGVMIQHHSVINLIEWVNGEYGIGPKDRLLFITSMCFDLSVYDIFGVLAAGGTVVIARNEEVQQIPFLKRLLLEERITFWDSVPTTMNYLIGELEADNDGFLQQDLRLVFLSGDWIPVQLPDRIPLFFPAAEVISLGGATEATVWSNYYPIREVNRSWSSIPYGKPIKNNSFYILNDRLQPVPKGVAGELYIGGVGVASGYANDEVKTTASFKPDPFNDRLGGVMYKTGDLGRILPDGNMEFLGRKDNQVKIRGFRVELGEIESILQRHDKIKGAIVDVNKDANGINQLCAYLLQEEGLDLPEIKDYLKGKLPAYMVPAHFMVLTSFPLNSNGKINRAALPRPSEEVKEHSAIYIPPTTDIQIRMAQIWKAILNLEKIGIRDDLFELGANSLSVGAFINRVHREFDLTVNIRKIFADPTIEAISLEIEKIRWANGQLFEIENINDTENFSI